LRTLATKVNTTFGEERVNSTKKQSPMEETIVKLMDLENESLIFSTFEYRKVITAIAKPRKPPMKPSTKSSLIIADVPLAMFGFIFTIITLKIQVMINENNMYNPLTIFLIINIT
jgi:hypothetical protein